MRDGSSYPHVADCDYFTVDKLNLDGNIMKKLEGNVSETSFASILLLDGKEQYPARVKHWSSKEETASFCQQEAVLIPWKAPAMR